MKNDWLKAVLDGLMPPPVLTLRDVEFALRKLFPDPLIAEQKIGAMYGGVFRRREAYYDASGGRLPTREEAEGGALSARKGRDS